MISTTGKSDHTKDRKLPVPGPGFHPRFTILCASLLVLSGVARAADEALFKLVQTIPLDGVEGRMDHFGVDPQRKRLYLAALGNNTLEVIDLAAGKRIKSITGLKKPTGIRVLP